MIRPSSDSPTTEGTSRSPPTGSMCGRPSSTCATREYVGPRSIPTTLLIAGDDHLGIPQDLSVEQVALPLFRDHLSGGNAGARLRRNRPVPGRIERLPHGGDPPDAPGIQRLAEPVAQQALP